MSNSFQLLSLTRNDFTAPATILEDDAQTPQAAPGLGAGLASTSPPNLSTVSDGATLAEGEAEKGVDESSAHRAPTPEPLRVLVVDDDNLTRVLMRKMLTRLGCAVESVENGRLALDALRAGFGSVGGSTPSAPLPTPASDGAGASSNRSRRNSYGLGSPPVHPANQGPAFDIVFMDNQMPVMSGLETVKELRGGGATDLVVGVTGNALLSDVEEFLGAGADQWVYSRLVCCYCLLIVILFLLTQCAYETYVVISRLVWVGLLTAPPSSCLSARSRENASTCPTSAGWAARGAL
jgi:CheY-like chemotaxis protein